VTPIRRFDAHGAIAKVTPATDEEKKAGVLLTLRLKDNDRVIQVAKKTDLYRSVG
jgi:hypothetical protein